MFAAFQADDKTQKMMGGVLRHLTANTSAHGNAGEASIFLVLAHRKLKEGGTLALVLPLSFMLGESWEESRDLVTAHYEDLIFVTNAGVGGADVSFSADTDIAECLVIGRKTNTPSKRASFITLNERPDSTISGTNIATQIRNAITHNQLRKIEDGPVGGTPILLGNELVGNGLSAAIGAGWNLARVRDLSLAQTAYQLTLGKLWLPGTKKSEVLELSVSTMAKIGEIGPYHADINGRTSNGGIRGPFDVINRQPNNTPTYPVLWSHDADRERTIAFEAESEGIPRKGVDDDEQELIDRKIDAIWAAASHAHFNRDFRFNSQSTALQFTKRKTIGGRAWLSISLSSQRHERALVLWANTTPGLLLYWWLANKQQAGRGSIGKNALENLTILDVKKLNDTQLKRSDHIFAMLSAKPLRPLNELAEDTNRHQLDRLFLTEVLGLPANLHAAEGPVELLRMKFAGEPSVTGQKKS